MHITSLEVLRYWQCLFIFQLCRNCGHFWTISSKLKKGNYEFLENRWSSTSLLCPHLVIANLDSLKTHNIPPRYLKIAKVAPKMPPSMTSRYNQKRKPLNILAGSLKVVVVRHTPITGIYWQSLAYIGIRTAGICTSVGYSPEVIIASDEEAQSWRDFFRKKGWTEENLDDEGYLQSNLVKFERYGVGLKLHVWWGVTMKEARNLSPGYLKTGVMSI